MKKLVAWLLVCLMIVSSLPIAAFAASTSKGLCPGLGKEHTLSNCDAKKVYGPTCGSGAVTGAAGYACKECGTTFANEEAVAAAHDWLITEAGVKANCLVQKTGVTEKKYCTICLTEAGGEKIEIHDDNDLSWTAGAKIDGDVYYFEGVCEDCGFVRIINNTDKPELLNHEWCVEPEIITFPTCYSFGLARYTCTDPECDVDPVAPGYQKATKDVTILRYDCADYGELVYVDRVAPDCHNDGVEAYYICTVNGCGRMYKTDKRTEITAPIAIPKYNHDPAKYNAALKELTSKIGAFTNTHGDHRFDVAGCDATIERPNYSNNYKYDWVLTTADLEKLESDPNYAGSLTHDDYKLNPGHDTTKCDIFEDNVYCGSYKRTCMFCEYNMCEDADCAETADEKKYEYTTQLKHDYETKYDTTLHCDVKGSVVKTCKICGHIWKTTREHSMKTVIPQTNPTCLLDGYAAQIQCENCTTRKFVAYKSNNINATTYAIIDAKAYGVCDVNGLVDWNGDGVLDANDKGYVDWNGDGKIDPTEQKFYVNYAGKCIAPGHDVQYVKSGSANLVVKSYCDVAPDFMIKYCANGAFCQTYDKKTSTEWTYDKGTATKDDDKKFVIDLTKAWDGTAIPAFDNFVEIEVVNVTTHANPAATLTEVKANGGRFWFAPKSGAGVPQVEKEPTCTDTGIWVCYCTACERNVSGVIAANGHDYVAKMYDVDTALDGMQADETKHWVICKDCEQYRDAAMTENHVLGDVKHNNLCVEITVNGFKVPANAKYKICCGDANADGVNNDGCGYVVIVDDTAFDYNKIYEATGTFGAVDYVCAYNNAAKDHKGLPAEKDWKYSIDCDLYGVSGSYRTYECSECDQMVFVSNADGHRYVLNPEAPCAEWIYVTDKNAECGKSYDCVYCGEEYTFFKDHLFDINTYVPFKAPTCPIDFDGDGLFDKQGESNGEGNLPYWVCGNGNGCRFVKYIDAASADGTGFSVVDGTNYKNDTVLAPLNHKNVVLESVTATDCTSIAYDHVGCEFCNRYVNAKISDWTYKWTNDDNWIKKATNGDLILASGEYIKNFAMGAHKNAAGETFTSLCDAYKKGITDTNCVVVGCPGVADHQTFHDANNETCYGYDCNRCGAPVEDATVPTYGKHNYGAYEAVNGTYAATGDKFVAGKVVTLPEKSFQVCEWCGIEKEYWFDVTNEIKYTLEIAPLYGAKYTMGSTVVVTVYVDADKPAKIAANEVVVKYDASFVELIDVYAVNGSPFSTVTDKKNGGYAVAVAATADGMDAVVNGKVAVAELHFVIHAGINDATAKFADIAGMTTSFEIVESVDIAGVIKANTFASNYNQDYAEELVGFKTIHTYAPVALKTESVRNFLDITEEGTFNSRDISAALQFDAFTYDERVDIDGDGIISAADIQDILDYHSGQKTAWELFATGIPSYIAYEINAANTPVAP